MEFIYHALSPTFLIPRIAVLKGLTFLSAHVLVCIIYLPLPTEASFS